MDLEHACPKVPYLHNRLELKPGCNFHATGISTWQAGNGDSGRDLPPFQQTYSVPITALPPHCRLCRALARTVSDMVWWPAQPRPYLNPCVSLCSIYRSEVVPGTTSLHYTDSQAAWKQSSMTTANGRPGVVPVEPGPASDGAARWGAADWIWDC